MSAVAPVLPTEEKPLSEAERVIDTFVAPTKTFIDLRRSANWLVPVLLLIVATIALVWVADTKIGFQKIVENQLAMQPKASERLDKLSPEDRAKQMETILKVNRIVSYLLADRYSYLPHHRCGGAAGYVQFRSGGGAYL